MSAGVTTELPPGAGLTTPKKTKLRRPPLNGHIFPPLFTLILYHRDASGDKPARSGFLITRGLPHRTRKRSREGRGEEDGARRAEVKRRKEEKEREESPRASVCPSIRPSVLVYLICIETTSPGQWGPWSILNTANTVCNPVFPRTNRKALQYALLTLSTRGLGYHRESAVILCVSYNNFVPRNVARGVVSDGWPA